MGEIRWVRVAVVALAFFAGLALALAIDHPVAQIAGVALPGVVFLILLRSPRADVT